MNKKLSIAEQRELTVRKANEIIQRSRFSLSAQQQKILLYLISKIKPQDKEFTEYTMSVIEFCDICGITKSGRTYEEIKAAIKAIADKSMWIELGDEAGTDALIRWIENPKILKKTGFIKVKLNEDMKPFLLELKKNYTSYELLWTLKFKSKYSIKLYELLKSVHYNELDTYSYSFTVERLQWLLDSNYKLYADFKRNALVPAITEINRYSDKIVTYKEIREGKAHSVKSIEIQVDTKDAIERIRLNDEIQKELGIDENQITVWDMLQEGEKKNEDI